MDTTSSETLGTGSEVMAVDMVMDTVMDRVMDRVMDTVMVKNSQVAATNTPVAITTEYKTSGTPLPEVEVQVMVAVLEGGSQWKSTQAPVMTTASCNTFDRHMDNIVGHTLDDFSSCSSLGAGTNNDNDDDDDSPVCRICYLNSATYPELGPLRTLCSCRGTMAFVHLACLERWLNESRSNRCELCGFKFKTQSTPTRALLPALASWVGKSATKLANQLVCFLLMTCAMVIGVRLTYEFITREDKNNVPWIERYTRGTISEKGRVWLARTVDCTVMNFESDMLGRYCVTVLRTVHADIRDWMRFWRSQSVIRVVLVDQPAASSVPMTSTTPLPITPDATPTVALPPDSIPQSTLTPIPV